MDGNKKNIEGEGNDLQEMEGVPSCKTGASVSTDNQGMDGNKKNIEGEENDLQEMEDKVSDTAQTETVSNNETGKDSEDRLEQSETENMDNSNRSENVKEDKDSDTAQTETISNNETEKDSEDKLDQSETENMDNSNRSENVKEGASSKESTDMELDVTSDGRGGNLFESQNDDKSDPFLSDSELGEGSCKSLKGNLPKLESKGEKPAVEVETPAQTDTSALLGSISTKRCTEPVCVQDFLMELGLKTLESEKLSLSDVLTISAEALENKVPSSPQDIPAYFLCNLMMFNSKSRNFKYSLTQEEVQSGKQETEDLDFLGLDEPPSDSYHPLDIITAIFLRANAFLQQELMLKMSLCQFALPLLLPDGNEGCTFLLWAMRSIVKKWRPFSLRVSKGFKETNMVIEHIPTFSFIRLGPCSISKSKVLNEILSNSEQQHNFFVHSNMECGNLPRKISNGLVELCWYLPSGSEDLDLFPEPMAILNLRGDGTAFEKQVQFLAKASSALFVFVNNIDSETSGILNSFAETVTNLVIILSGKDITEETKSHMKTLVSLSVVKRNHILVMGRKNDAEFAQLLRSTLKEIAAMSSPEVGGLSTVESQTTGKRLGEMAEIAREIGINVDEDDKQSSESQRKSKEILHSIGTEGIENFKKVKMTFQGDTWQKLSKLEKESCRLKKRGQMSVNEYLSKLDKNQSELRNERRRKGVPADIKTFIAALTERSGDERKHFLQWMKFGLDFSSRETLSVLREEYKALYEKSQEVSADQRKTAAATWKHLQGLDKQISTSSLGLEHFMREIGLIYETLIDQKNQNKEEKCIVQQLPHTAADLMLDGVPLELIDGDVSNIPLQWVTAVLKEIEHKIGTQTRVFVLTVLGVQSTGKSTLLNTMFGLQFAVSSGRCTRGAFMQLIKVTGDLQKELGCGYIMVIDTEGLKAPELSNIDDSYEHDNELATLVIGLSDVTLVNMAMENSTEMKDVLQIVVHAFIRMKEVGKKPTCYFVHQNVSDVSAHDQNMRGRKQLLEQLDTMTRAAAKMEKQDCRFTKFSDVLDYDAKENNWNIPGLWHGNPPMAAVNTGYSQKVFELKKMIFKSFTNHQNKRKFSTISEFMEWTKSLWKAVKYENFIFSFRNSLVAEAYKELSIKYTDLEWELRKEIHSFVEMEENRIYNATDDPERLAQSLKRKRVSFMEEKKQKALQELEDYFSTNDRANLVEKYRSDFFSSIDSVIKERAMYADMKSDKAVQRWRDMKKLDDIKASYQSRIEEQVNDLLKRCRQEKRGMRDTELWEEFQVMWEATLSTLTHGPQKESTIVSDMENCLTQKMHSHLITEKLIQKNSSQVEMTLFQVTNNHIERKTDDDTKPKSLFKKCCSYFYPQKSNEMLRAVQWAGWCWQECEEFVEQIVQRNQDYDSTYFRHLLRIVEEKIGEHNDNDFTFNEKFNVEYTVHICSLAAVKFETMQAKFRKKNDALELLKHEKENYFKSFKNIYQEKDQTKQRAELFCKSCLQPALLNAVNKKLGPDIVEYMRYHGKGGKFKFRKNFQVALMLHLKEEDNFEKYHEYIQRTVPFEQKWLRKQVTKYCAAVDGEQPLLCYLALDVLKRFISLVKETLKQVTSQTNEATVHSVIQMFKEKLESDFQIPGSQLAAITLGATNINLEHFTQEIANFVCEVEDHLVQHINGWRSNIGAKLKTLPIDPSSELYTMLSGCGASCPFCGVLCDCTNPTHSEHSAEYHRSQGLTGYHSIKSRKLVTENCTTLVASDTKFRNKDTNKEFWPYKDYRNLGMRYNCWNITADTTIETSAFWKWVLYKYNKQFAQKYAALPANPITSWDLSWDKIKEDIETTYNIKVDEFY
ncbi:interferon-induced very large GTPase 1-like isoform X2 [Scyliorhinus canicula]|uniref:interferon-induced very large GTPase 1-like isoform X2 n=1 Tax=Scyliorhinus canicula TaxID=7830 RepID=UPI0018F546F6|nr:interferon-induced very large GTPase 1-like isoform X2 [Scyliorhinus canicula]